MKVHTHFHTRTIQILATLLALAGLNACKTGQAPGSEPPNWQQTADGVVVDIERGGFNKLRLQVIDDAIVRVTATPGEDFSILPDTLMVIAEPMTRGFTVAQTGETVVVKTIAMSAEVALNSGEVRFLGADGKPLLVEAGRSLSPLTTDSFTVRQQFLQAEDAGVYGLGQQQDGRVNYAGQNVELTTGNMEISIPFLVSTQGYGLLWNNTSITRLGDPRSPRPLADGFELFDTGGKPGGLTVRYFEGDELLLERVEADLDYQFLSRANVREHPLPEEVENAENLRVVWEGTIVPKAEGEHEFKMYSSGYAKLSLDGGVLLDRWRMNWNPWYHNATVDMRSGRAYRLKLDWKVGRGYFRLLHYPPAAAGDAAKLSIASETGRAVDYYFVAADSMDYAVAGYRKLTGKATMLPRWAFGFWQSRERYKSQDELLENLVEYRKRGIPIDNIVLDWSYWPVDAWGSHDFDAKFFPDPKGMVDRIHDLNARVMISVWPKFYPGTANYTELNAAGCMFNKNIEERNFDWIGEGYLNGFYDAFGDHCRDIYWRQLKEKINNHGFDAWWLDAVEPDMHSNLSFEHRKDLMTPNTLGTGAEYFNAYALPHAETVAQGEREVDGHQRSFILTRSGFGGIQRTGSAIWSGDVVSRWSNLREQIAAGIGAGIAGMPYWTHDIGGFTPEDHYRWNGDVTVGHYSGMAAEHQAAWQELNVRWFQFGAFTPLFRSHGQNPYREIFNVADKGSEAYESMVWHTELRYRLMPYIYTLAGDAYHRDGTIMRGLVMDFPDDPGVRDLGTQFMFGPAFLVAPVVEPGDSSREVYLPAGTDWYDFYTGAKTTGGKTVGVAAPLMRMPLFVMAGSIIPTGPAIQHTGESLNAPITLNVFTGADGSFDIYEDDGLSYAYENGQWSRIPVSYKEATGSLTIGAREGGFESMAEKREIAIRWITGTDTVPADFVSQPDESLSYTGEAVTLTLH